jgi:hypothetical protein
MTWDFGASYLPHQTQSTNICIYIHAYENHILLILYTPNASPHPAKPTCPTLTSSPPPQHMGLGGSGEALVGGI